MTTDLPPLRDVIARHGLAASKALGQNFLLDGQLLDRIAAVPGKLAGEHVYEVGPGPGGLTRALLKAGAASVPVFGVGYPADSAYMPPTKPAAMEKNYEMLPGQKYPLIGRTTGDYYWAKTYAPAYPYTDFVVVKDGTEYYQISFNHRGALVRTSDVDLVASP